ncbi:MAG: ABC transporter ATP-binding protein [Rhodanobacteraceae bacterium]|nr:ABC transporter ATP-binding protein [Rhodanobacteraceae bacterium]
MQSQKNSLSLNPFEGATKYLRIFSAHLGSRIYLIFVLALLVALTEGFGITLLLPLLGAMDAGAGFSDSTPAAITRVLQYLGVEKSSTGLLILIGSVFVVKALITFAHGAYGGFLQAKLMHELKMKIFSGCAGMTLGYYTTRSTGHFVNIINTQVGAFYQSFTALISFYAGGIKAMAYLSMAFLLSWRFAALVVIFGAVVLFSFRHLNAHVRTLSRAASKEMSTLNNFLVQALQSFKYLVSTNKMQHMRSTTEESILRVTGLRVRQHIWQAATNSLNEPVSILTMIAIIMLQTIVFKEPLGPVLVVLLLFHRGLGAMVALQAQWQAAMNSIGAVEMVESELQSLAKNAEKTDGQLAPILTDGIRLENVSFSYSTDLGNAIENVTLAIPARSTVALVGESGAGKSTLVDILSLMLRPQSGCLTIDGVPAHSLDPRSWRDQIGYVSQETVIFNGSIAANIAMGESAPSTPEGVQQRIRKAAADAQLATFIESLPQQYDTQVGDRGICLSGGQRQRLFIARELYGNPRLLILDEATSALDSESERGVQASIDALHGQVTVIIIAHRLSTIRNVDRVFVLHAGRVVEEGDYSELRSKSDSRFHTMVEMQAL